MVLTRDTTSEPTVILRKKSELINKLKYAKFMEFREL